MAAFLNNPFAFFGSGWSWFWQHLAETDGRIMLLAGVVAWFLLERLMSLISDPVLKAFFMFGVVAAVIFGGTVLGGAKSATGPANRYVTHLQQP